MRHFVGFALVLASTPAMAQAQAGSPGPKYAAQGEFSVLQLSTTDPEGVQKVWAQTTPGVEISTQDTATRNQFIYSFVLFRGCMAGEDGKCRLSTRFSIIGPNGKPYGQPHTGVTWDRSPPPAANVQLGNAIIGLRVEDGEALGRYRFIAQTTDHVANITLTTQQTVTVAEAPLAGGWSAVASPNTDAEIRAAAAAVLAHIPDGNAQLAQVETAQRQVVAGTTIRLALRLVDGSRWSALVWHKLDGSFEVHPPVPLQ
jgi:hypothetical protein